MKQPINNIVTKFVRRFFNESEKSLLINADFSNGKTKMSMFGLADIPSSGKPTFFLDYFKDSDSKEYDCIIAELPFGLGPVKNKELNLSIPENWEMIYRLLISLKEEGDLLVGVEPSFAASKKSKDFIKALERKSFFLNALIEMPQGTLAPYTFLQPNIAIFSKKDNKGLLFIASLDESGDEKIIFDNFSNRRKGDFWVSGDIIEAKNFSGFSSYRVDIEIDNLQTQYKEFKKVNFDKIAVEINYTRSTFEEREGQYLYIPKIGKLNVFSTLNRLDKKQHNFYQVKIEEKIASVKYLEQYFRSDLGQLSLKVLFSGAIIQQINRNELWRLTIPLPPLKTQEEIISSYNLLENVTAVIKSLEKDLSLNPKSAKKIIDKLIGTLDHLNELSKTDEILHYLRQGENLKIEYKQTFSTDIKNGKKEKYIEESSLKNIVGFLNKKGGFLLIGVSDDGNIYGIENDNYQSDDKYLLHFKNKLKSSIGEEYFDLIEYEIVDVNGRKVLFVKCSQSSKPVYLNGKDFYVRSSPAVDKLEGPKLVDYIKTHFKENKT